MIPEKLDIAIEWPPLDKGGVEMLEKYMQDNPDVGLIIIDTLGKVRSKEAANSNAYAGDYAIGGQLKRLIDKYPVAILLVTHTRKAESDDPLQMVTGTMGLTGGMDGTLVLKRERGKEQASLYVTGRDVPDDGYYALTWNKETCRWKIDGDAKEVFISEARKEILSYLASKKTAMSARDIADGLGRKHDATRRLLPDMVKDGLIEEIKDGRRWMYVHPLYNQAPISHTHGGTTTPPSSHSTPTPPSHGGVLASARHGGSP